jgi:N-dimethylarginine dimethylaminohydrolase
MCPPDHFAVRYAINPWMNPALGVDVALAHRQWDRLRRTYLELGHRVDVLEPEPGLPDMVFAANGGLVIGGRALGARFAHPQRAGEGPAYLAGLRRAGLRSVTEATQVNEGEGDFLTVGGRVLAGTGFRTARAAHAEVAALFGLPVVTLRLVDPRFYHLDTALAVLDDSAEHPLIAYHPGAFDPAGQDTLRRLYPDAVLAAEADAAVLGLNAVSDGRHVVLAEQATGLAAMLRDRGFDPIGVNLSELLKAGGGAKCCTLEVRS